jgi:hypothetical protein
VTHASARLQEIKIGLLRRLTATTVQTELIEARMVNGEQLDVGTCARWPVLACG